MEQVTLPGMATALGASGTFALNKQRSVHRWYPYIEGFSAEFVTALLEEFGPAARSVHDPFMGAGTTAVTGARSARSVTYCEVNPFLRLVTETKTNIGKRASRHPRQAADWFDRVAARAEGALPTGDEAHRELDRCFEGKAYFETRRLREVVALRRAIGGLGGQWAPLGWVALASVMVGSSNLRRTGDLRYRPAGQHPPVWSPIEQFRQRAHLIVEDLHSRLFEAMGDVAMLTESALDQPPASSAEPVDLVITSPPYLNGTSYFKNTKLEMWVCGYLGHESELSHYRTRAVTAAINNVTGGNRCPLRFPFVEDTVERLEEVAYDRRVPTMVRSYFSDAHGWLRNVHRVLRPGGKALVDIGDSRFAGVHIRTDRFLSGIAEETGLCLLDRRVLRRRRSRDGSPLTQFLLVFERP